MKIFLASDHAGFDLKEKLKPFLADLHYEVEDDGDFAPTPEDDYTDFVSACIKKLLEVRKTDPEVKAIIIGGSGQGEAIMANRFPGIRAAVYYGGTENDKNIITLSREHNDANVLSLGARFLNEEETKNAVKMWLETPFSGEERHARRIKKIEEIVEEYKK